MKKTNTKNDTIMLKDAVVSVWSKAHAFEEAWRQWGECEDDAAYEEYRPIVTDLADDFVCEYEKYEKHIELLIDPVAADIVGGDYAMLALYCYGWWQEAEGVIASSELEG